MPYNFTHALLGQYAREHVSPATRAAIDASPGAFWIGTMGPDPYFGDAILKPRRPLPVDLSQTLHEMDMRTLYAAFAHSAETNAQVAYVLGFLCHFVLDTTAHPYIEARFPGAAHTIAEIALDLPMLRRAGCSFLPAPPRRFYRTNALSELDALHAGMVKTLYAVDAAGAFARTLRKWLCINTVTYDPRNRKQRFLTTLSRAIPALTPAIDYLLSQHPDPDDRMNLACMPWRAPFPGASERTESFPALFDTACREAAPLLDAAHRSLTGGDDAYVYALLGGRRMDAFPIAEDV